MHHCITGYYQLGMVTGRAYICALCSCEIKHVSLAQELLNRVTSNDFSHGFGFGNSFG